MQYIKSFLAILTIFELASVSVSQQVRLDSDSYRKTREILSSTTLASSSKTKPAAPAIITVVTTLPTTTKTTRISDLSPQIATTVEPNTINDFGRSTQQARKYAVVVDCGSSGTRAHIFKCLQNQDSSNISFEPVRDVTSGKPLIKRILPGLSTLREHAEDASEYMRPIMEFLNENIPSEDRHKTPIYFLGTAGMRLLTRGEQDRILDDLKRDLPKEYDFDELYMEVISGADEGIYQWISVNFNCDRMKESFDQDSTNFHCQAPQARRYGMLEMGGASTQVTFEVTKPLDDIISFRLSAQPEALRVYKDSIKTVNLGELQPIRIFSATFLGFGTGSIRNLIADLIVRDQIKLPTRFSPLGLFTPLFYSSKSTLVVEDPCLPFGSQEILVKPTQLLYDQQKTVGYIAAPGDETFTVRLIGRGNYFLCQSLVNRILILADQQKLNCPNKFRCTTSLIGTNFVPFAYLHFIGLSEYFYTTNEMIRASGQFNWVMIMQNTIRICSTPYDSLLEQYPEANRVDPDRVLHECLKATWIISWLQFGLRMPPNLSANLTTLSHVNGMLVDWTLGALLANSHHNDGVEKVRSEKFVKWSV